MTNVENGCLVRVKHGKIEKEASRVRGRGGGFSHYADESIHVIFGMMVFASLLFICLFDAITPCGNYLTSMTVWRYRNSKSQVTFLLEKKDGYYEPIEEQNRTSLICIMFGEYEKPQTGSNTFNRHKLIFGCSRETSVHISR